MLSFRGQTPLLVTKICSFSSDPESHTEQVTDTFRFTSEPAKGSRVRKSQVSQPYNVFFLLSPQLCICLVGCVCVWRSENSFQVSVWRLEETLWELVLAFLLALAGSLACTAAGCASGEPVRLHETCGNFQIQKSWLQHFFPLIHRLFYNGRRPWRY